MSTFAAESSSRFDSCLAFTLAREGFFSDDPRDTGGPTMEGITLASYRAWTGDPLTTVQALRAVSAAVVRAFYASQFWHPLQCDLLPAGSDLLVFDHAVLAGVRRSAMLLQQAVGATVDGWIGPGTLGSLHKVPVPDLINAVADMQDHYYRLCPGFPTFGRGWLSRLAQRKATAVAAAGAASPPPPVLRA